MTLHVPGEAPRDGLFLCLVSNVSPWTYLGHARFTAIAAAAG